jgi:hypothetical protein
LVCSESRKKSSPQNSMNDDGEEDIALNSPAGALGGLSCQD